MGEVTNLQGQIWLLFAGILTVWLIVGRSPVLIVCGECIIGLCRGTAGRGSGLCAQIAAGQVQDVVGEASGKSPLVSSLLLEAVGAQQNLFELTA